ncbi:MAG: hypothetical protein WCB67_16715 [Solirubrobacteraceae bacterium]
MSGQFRNLALRVITPFTDQTKSDALVKTVHELERRVQQLEFSLHQQSERAERLEIVSQDLVTAADALRQRTERDDRGPGTDVPSRAT